MAVVYCEARQLGIKPKDIDRAEDEIKKTHREQQDAQKKKR
jgi:hypothetical protein